MASLYFKHKDTGAVYFSHETDHSSSTDIPRTVPDSDLLEITEEQYKTLDTANRAARRQEAQENVAANKAVEDEKAVQKRALVKQGYDYLIGLGMPEGAARAVSGWTGA